MTHHVPTAQIYAVRASGEGPAQCVGRVTVRCPYCTQLHAHRVFDNDRIEFMRTAPCSAEADVRRYRVDLSLPTRRSLSELNQTTAGDDLNDAAIDVPLPNWTE